MTRLDLCMTVTVDYDFLTDSYTSDKNTSNKNKIDVDEPLTTPHSIYSTCNKAKCNRFFDYDDDTIALIDDQTETTVLYSSDNSAGNTNLDSIDVFEIDMDDIEFNYHGPKVLPKNEVACTICTVNTIGTLRSRHLFRVLFDSGSTVTLTKKGILPRGVILKEL